MQPSLRNALLLLALLASGCRGTRKLTDPVLEIRSESGAELGVATDYGLVFLGRTARSGPIDVTAWYGDVARVRSTSPPGTATGRASSRPWSSRSAAGCSPRR